MFLFQSEIHLLFQMFKKIYCLGTTALPGDVFYIDQKFIVIIEEALKINILFSLNWILKTDTLG